MAVSSPRSIAVPWASERCTMAARPPATSSRATLSRWLAATRGEHRGGREQRGDAVAEGERDIAAEDRSQHPHQLVGVAQPATERDRHQLGAEALLVEQLLGGAPGVHWLRRRRAGPRSPAGWPGRRDRRSGIRAARRRWRTSGSAAARTAAMGMDSASFCGVRAARTRTAGAVRRAGRARASASGGPCRWWCGGRCRGGPGRRRRGTRRTPGAGSRGRARRGRRAGRGSSRRRGSPGWRRSPRARRARRGPRRSRTGRRTGRVGARPPVGAGCGRRRGGRP